MPLYLLEQVRRTVGYDETKSVVVRAENSKEARQLASTACGGEGKATWLSPKSSSCKRLPSYGMSVVILRSFIGG